MAELRTGAELHPRSLQRQGFDAVLRAGARVQRQAGGPQVFHRGLLVEHEALHLQRAQLQLHRGRQRGRHGRGPAGRGLHGLQRHLFRGQGIHLQRHPGMGVRPPLPLQAAALQAFDVHPLPAAVPGHAHALGLPFGPEQRAAEALHLHRGRQALQQPGSPAFRHQQPAQPRGHAGHQQQREGGNGQQRQQQPQPAAHRRGRGHHGAGHEGGGGRRYRLGHEAQKAMPTLKCSRPWRVSRP
ncbi:hypothetical protein D621_13120 [beta proteobacterium AAP51]|nr:hypothetical protein D621_13120 [beta proteobacterium AAP51]